MEIGRLVEEIEETLLRIEEKERVFEAQDGSIDGEHGAMFSIWEFWPYAGGTRRASPHQQLFTRIRVHED